MIDGTYSIDIDTIIGNPQGEAVIRTEGETAHINIDVPVLGKQKAKGKVEGDDTITAQGSFVKFLLGKVKYNLRATVDGDTIFIAIKSNKGDFEFTGTRE